MNQPAFLSLHGSYNKLDIALFNGSSCLEQSVDENIKSSAQLIPLLDCILKKHSLAISSLSFVAIDQGPGAFTSLRVMLATANAFGFDDTIPLIGVDGLDALAKSSLYNLCNVSSFKNGESQFLVALLNAYNNDVYVGIYKIENEKLILINKKTSKNIDVVLNELKLLTTESIFFTGNGTTLHERAIQTYLGTQACIIKPTLQTCSALHIAKIALEKWEHKDICYKLYPLYLKSQLFAIRK